jgi:uncharacterized membrane protein YidH (DUF202 family)
MTRQPLAQDRGLQRERTALAWTRTTLAVATSGELILLRDRNAFDLLHDPARLVTGGLAMVVAVGVFWLGLRRRRELAVKPIPSSGTARRNITGVGVSVALLSALIVVYLSTAHR